ncbi:hypothetical protein MLD38_032783 [Melastoma candidum]|uniref:Uncharacterized protein n=1 Tax=Melastoma candidum TaxID=119954 RepID=A0ACB9M515_9MYRT|nr:hypothetical protein MLD38_032783 [Melastoma candidum]
MPGDTPTENNSFDFGCSILLLSLAMTSNLLLREVVHHDFLGIFHFATRAYNRYVEIFFIEQAQRQSPPAPSPTPVLGLVRTAQDARTTCGDMERVMERLGIFKKRGGPDALSNRIGSNGVTNIFEKEELGVDEVKAAFYMFDENCDGYI